MSQKVLDLINQNFPPARTDISDFRKAISSQQSGLSAPPDTVQYQYWADTTNDLLKRRDSGDTAFLPFDTLLDSRIDTKTVNYTQLLADMNRTIFLDASSGDLTVDLLDAAISLNGHVTTWKRIDSSANTVLLDNFGGQTIDGVANLELIGENATAKVRSNGTNLFRETKVLGKPPAVISRIPIGYDPSQLFTLNSFQRLVQSQIGSSFQPVNLWDPTILKSGRIFIEGSISGAALSPFQMAIQVVQDPAGAATVVLESNAIDIGNQSSLLQTRFSVNVSTGNATNLDLTTTLLNSVNDSDVSGTKRWDFNIKADIGGGSGYSVRDLAWVLLDY